MFFFSVFLCVTSSVSFTGFYTEDEPNNEQLFTTKVEIASGEYLPTREASK